MGTTKKIQVDSDTEFTLPDSHGSPDQALRTNGAGTLDWATITATDVGLGNVTNESKATMFTDAALTGDSTAVTQSASDNSTKIATTAYVDAAAGGSGGGNLNIFANQTDIDNYTATEGDQLQIDFDGGVFDQALTGCNIFTTGSYTVEFQNNLLNCTFNGYNAKLSADSGTPTATNCAFHCENYFIHGKYFRHMYDCTIKAEWVYLGTTHADEIINDTTIQNTEMTCNYVRVVENTTSSKIYTLQTCTIFCKYQFAIGTNGAANADRLKLSTINHIVCGGLSGTLWCIYNRCHIECTGNGAGSNFHFGITEGSSENDVKTHDDTVADNVPYTVVSRGGTMKIDYTNKVAASVGRASGQQVSSSTFETIEFDTVALDTHSAYDTSTGEYTVPLTGIYSISTQVGYNADTAWDEGEQSWIEIHVDGVAKKASNRNERYANDSTSTHQGDSVNALLSLEKGDVVKTVAYQNSAATYLITIGNVAYTFLDLHKI